VTLFAGANSGSNSNIYYSFNQGLTHFIVFSAEAYIYAVDKTFLANQLAFMTKDLAAVNRKITPWVVALVHKDWTMEAAAFNDFSPILDKGGVDILFCGHVSNTPLPLIVLTAKVRNGLFIELSSHFIVALSFASFIYRFTTIVGMLPLTQSLAQLILHLFLQMERPIQIPSTWL
jgi:hypothetical protein